MGILEAKVAEKLRHWIGEDALVQTRALTPPELRVVKKPALVATEATLSTLHRVTGESRALLDQFLELLNGIADEQPLIASWCRELNRADPDLEQRAIRQSCYVLMCATEASNAPSHMETALSCLLLSVLMRDFQRKYLSVREFAELEMVQDLINSDFPPMAVSLMLNRSNPYGTGQSEQSVKNTEAYQLAYGLKSVVQGFDALTTSCETRLLAKPLLIKKFIAAPVFHMSDLPFVSWFVRDVLYRNDLVSLWQDLDKGFNKKTRNALINGVDELGLKN